MTEKKLGLPSVVSTGVGVVVATSCLISLGIGSSVIRMTFIISMVIAGILNILFALSVSELNALMPNLTGGLAQYTLASMGPFVSIIVMVGGYLVCNTIVGSAECAMFCNTIASVLPNVGIPGNVYSVILIVVLIITNLNSVDVFAKIQNVVTYTLIGSLVIMRLIGFFKLGTGIVVTQPMILSTNFTYITALCGLAFFLFIGSEFIIPISNRVQNARRNVPLGLIITLIVVFVMETLLVFGFHNYTAWADLGSKHHPSHLIRHHAAGEFWYHLDGPGFNLRRYRCYQYHHFISGLY